MTYSEHWDVEKKWLWQLASVDGVSSVYDHSHDAWRVIPESSPPVFDENGDYIVTRGDKCEQACPNCGADALHWRDDFGMCAECREMCNPCVCGEGFLEHSYTDVDAHFECDTCHADVAFPGPYNFNDEGELQ